ncbi:SPL family radical SAM protein [Desulfatitalea tepidiphila]|uniref:SPL family radical SAM protein n=1 Tax=Desulfatitalea tepidiphila TaxID=1185843 RepID=UPI0006B597AA|nr:radical SAM protein [Desulfatitalea tepidiphila]
MDTETIVESKQKRSEDDNVKEIVDDIVIPAFHKVPEPKKKADTKKTVIFHDKPGTALTKQKEIDSHNFPFTLNTGIGCHFGCQYCYVQGYPFNLQAEFPIEAKVKLWIADKLDKELEKYKHLPQHLKRVQVNPATEGYLPLVIAKVEKELKRDIMAEVLQVFRKHWENDNKWMVHLVTKSHMIYKHLDIIRDMTDQVQLEITITTLDENRRRKMEGWAPSVSKRLKVIEKFASGGVFVRAMCMPLIGEREDAEAIRNVCFDNGARAFKHKGVNYWDESALLTGETKRTKGRVDEVFKDLLVKSGEPYLVDGEIQKMVAMMPVIVKSGKSKRWMGYKLANLRNRNMVIVDSGYSDINDIDWGYVK